MTIRKKILHICNENDIVFLGIFGSFIKGNFADDSDIDFLVRFSRPKSLLELVKIERLFSQVLGRKVDLLTEASLSPHLEKRIKEEMKVYYERTR